MNALAKRLVKYGIRTVAFIYLTGIWLDGAGIPLTAKVLPKPFDYFLYVAALFPVASTAASEYRAEGYVCEDDRWTELDVRPYFRVHADDKESRFQRGLYFYHDNMAVKVSMDRYLVDAHNAGNAEDGIPAGKKIGGVRFIRVHVPIPPPGSIERYRRIPLTEVENEDKNSFYQSSRKRIRARCGQPEEDEVPAQGPGQEEDGGAGAESGTQSGTGTGTDTFTGVDGGGEN